MQSSFLIGLSFFDIAGPGAVLFGGMFALLTLAALLVMGYQRLFTKRAFVAGQASRHNATFVSGHVRKRVSKVMIATFFGGIFGVLWCFVDLKFFIPMAICAWIAKAWDK